MKRKRRKCIPRGFKSPTVLTLVKAEGTYGNMKIEKSSRKMATL